MMTRPMDKDIERPPLTRKLRTSDIEEDVAHTIQATPAEMAAIVKLLDLVGLEGLKLEYRLRHGAGGRVHLAGHLTAQATQTCVVSLEPVQSVIDVPVEAKFWPAPLVEELEHKAEDPGRAGLLDWPETITDGTIDLGALAYQTLATALDPYPKKPGASFQWSQGAKAAEDGESGPFAALKQLKQR
jgi:uncharacterized metal-binding protein YceD (DUF177 family)